MKHVMMHALTRIGTDAKTMQISFCVNLIIFYIFCHQSECHKLYFLVLSLPTFESNMELNCL